MTKRLIDIDDDALDAARAALGTRTMRDTVNTALRHAADAGLARRALALDALAGITHTDRADAWR